QPWAKARQMAMLANEYAPGRRVDVSNEARCFVVGVPQAPMLQGMNLRYVPGAVVFVYNKGTRIIPMDGTPHISTDINLFRGDSRGHWEGNTLVIETINNRDNTWFDAHATFHSQAMHVVERLTMVSKDTMYYEVTITDPTVFTQPWKMAQTYDRGRM